MPNPTVSISVSNAAVMENFGRRIGGRMAKVIPIALQEIGDAILQEAIPLTPIATGALRNSGRVEVEHTRGWSSMTISFGDDNVRYAGIVHERLDLFHEVGQAKYLEAAYLNNLPWLTQMFHDRIWSEIGLR